MFFRGHVNERTNEKKNEQAKDAGKFRKRRMKSFLKPLGENLDRIVKNRWKFGKFTRLFGNGSKN